MDRWTHHSCIEEMGKGRGERVDGRGEREGDTTNSVTFNIPAL